MKKINISITDDTGNILLYNVINLLEPITKMSPKESYRYHTMCARATLYPNKTIEEVNDIIDDTLSKW